MSDRPRCQAILLTKPSRSWSKVHRDGDIRCSHRAKSLVLPFCGNHAHLADHIVEIVWKED